MWHWIIAVKPVTVISIRSDTKHCNVLIGVMLMLHTNYESMFWLRYHFNKSNKTLKLFWHSYVHSYMYTYLYGIISCAPLVGLINYTLLLPIFIRTDAPNILNLDNGQTLIITKQLNIKVWRLFISHNPFETWTLKCTYLKRKYKCLTK